MGNGLPPALQGPRSLRDRLTFAVRQGSRVRKLFKLTFRPKSADFYIAFPYLVVPSYRCGVRYLGDEPSTVVSTTASGDIIESETPVKLSFHESGVVHCKAQDNAAHGGTTLARTRSVPFSQLSGQHILTVEAERIEAFAEATAAEQMRSDMVTFDVPGDAARVKVTAFAGFSVSSVSGKMVNSEIGALPPHVVTQFARPHLPRPLCVGFYLAPRATLQTTAYAQPSIIVLAGFRSQQPDASFLFLHANNPTEFDGAAGSSDAQLASQDSAV
jgi:hypothetical protein